jgi:hypothetical protein
VLGEEAVSLVLNGDGDVGEGDSVLTAVVRAEEKLAGGQLNANIGARPAPVAAVGGGQGLDRRRGHISM